MWSFFKKKRKKERKKEMETNIMVRFGNLRNLKNGGASNRAGKTVGGRGQGAGANRSSALVALSLRYMFSSVQSLSRVQLFENP